MHQPVKAEASPGWLQPSWRTMGLVAVVTTSAFLLPQEIPLEWYSVDKPGTDIAYLEITCAADVHGVAQIQYDLARDGHRPIDTIRWPISPSTPAYTYIFPLPDAPLTELRVAPPAGGALTVRQMRITNRRGEEIRRFTRDAFRPQHEISAIDPLTDGWKITSALDAHNPYARMEIFSPIIPVGMNHRNFLRCVLSTSYLALMLTILLLAVLFIFYRPTGWRDLLSRVSFMATLAVCFSFVGNRGLIRNSLNYARYIPPTPALGLKLEIDVASSFRVPAQLFWDLGEGMSETTSARATYEPHTELQTLRFALPAGGIRALRLDPGDGAGKWDVRGLRVVDNGQRTRAILPLDSLVAVRQIEYLGVDDDRLHLVSIPAATDPITNFTAAAVNAVNRTLAAPPLP